MRINSLQSYNFILSKVEHYRVKYKDNQLTIDDEEFFENLAQLVEVCIHFCE